MFYIYSIEVIIHMNEPQLPKHATLLVVDDSPENLSVLSELLKNDYQVRAAINGEVALKILQKEHIDLVLLDIVMPGMDGYAVCKKMKQTEQFKNIPVIFLTARTSDQDEQFGFDVGASDYLAKPFSPPIVKARIRTHLQNKKSQDFLKDQNSFLETEVVRRTKEVSFIQDATIMAMASLAETRDKETGNHIRRTQSYVRSLAVALRSNEQYREMLTDDYIEILYKSAPLHDIGKVGIPDSVLCKPGKLTDDEFDVMRSHTRMGRDAIISAEDLLPETTTFLQTAKEIAYGHHEKWDGSGYPQRLVGEAIPLSARLMALADVYDALISKRVYKDAMTHDQACDIIYKGDGAHFDPSVIAAFRRANTEFEQIAEKFMD